MDVSFTRSFDGYVAIAMYSKVCNATNFQYQAFSSLDKHDSHVATTVKVRKTS